MRLDRYLSNSGKGTRKEVRKHIAASNITVNGEVYSHPGSNIERNDIVRMNGDIIDYKEFVYLMLNKPKGYLSAAKDKKDRVVIDLIGERYERYKLSTVGRLDKDTEGLMILTNDGDLIHSIISPKKHVLKKYYVETTGIYSDEIIKVFDDGIRLDDGYVTLPAKMELLGADETNRFYVTIYEGKFHQIKRMFANVGMKVTYLKRIQIDGLELDKALAVGAYRELTEAETERLRK